jgi:hypothetical protein
VVHVATSAETAPAATHESRRPVDPWAGAGAWWYPL